MRAREYFCLSFPCIHDLRSCERHRIQIERENTYSYRTKAYARIYECWILRVGKSEIAFSNGSN